MFPLNFSGRRRGLAAGRGFSGWHGSVGECIKVGAIPEAVPLVCDWNSRLTLHCQSRARDLGTRERLTD